MQQQDYSVLTDPASIAANRAGHLSIEQHRRLESEANRPVVGAVLVLLLIGAGFILPLPLALGIFGSGDDGQLNPVCAAPLALTGCGLLALAVVVPVSARRRGQRLHDEVASGTVAQDEGEVTYTRHGYEARLDLIPSRTTSPIIGPLHQPLPPRRVQLPPGRYRFYYLPNTRTLLAAEPLTPIPRAPAVLAPFADPLAGVPHTMPELEPFPIGKSAAPVSPLTGQLGVLQDALAAGNRFTLADLAVNRTGRLTARQARRLVAPLVLLVPLMPFAAAFFFIGISMLHPSASGLLPMTLSVAVALALAGGELVALAFGLRRITDALGRQVHTVAGIVTGEVKSSGDSATYRYRVNGVHGVNGMTFQVSGQGYIALVSGLAYRIYYTPHSKTLVSIEPLGDAHA